LHTAAGLFNRRNRRLRRAINDEIDLGLELAVAQEAHAVVRAPQYARIDQDGGVDLGAVIEMQATSIDSRLDAAEIHFVEMLGEVVIEATLRQTPMQRHLSAFEAFDADAGPCGLTLAAAAAGFAHARADSATDALAGFARPRPVGNLVELHCNLLPGSATLLMGCGDG